MKSWVTYMYQLAQHIATKSKDPSRQVGCVIIGPDFEIRSTGFNGFPRGVRERQLEGKHEPYVISKNPAKVGCNQCGPAVRIDVTQEDFDKYMFTTDWMMCSPHFQPGQVQLITERWARPAKYDWVEHAERNAIYNAARMGIALKGCTAYITLAPCAACTRALIQAGIIEVYGPVFPEGIEYKDYGFDKSKIMMQEAGINYHTVDHAQEDTT